MTINERSTTCGLNFSIQLYAFLTQEEPVYLQTNFHYVYYLKYTELKRLSRAPSLGAQTSTLASKSL